MIGTLSQLSFQHCSAPCFFSLFTSRIAPASNENLSGKVKPQKVKDWPDLTSDVSDVDFIRFQDLSISRLLKSCWKVGKEYDSVMGDFLDDSLCPESILNQYCRDV